MSWDRLPVAGRALRSWRRLHAEIETLGRRQSEIEEEQRRRHSESEEEQRRRQSEIEGSLAELDRQLAALRQVVLRSSESSGMAARLQALRRTETYAAAYLETPLVSVRIGAYQPADALFEAALVSVRAQSYEHWEAVVVFDGPDPESAARVEAIGDSRIRSYQRPQRSVYPSDSDSRWLVAGVHPFNEAIAHTRGQWIAPLDQDDEWPADHIEVLLDAARATRAELVYGVCAVPMGPAGETYFGAVPPAQGDFGFQAAIYHAGIAEFMLYDYNAYLGDEPADWNLARRMLEAGVKFEFVERVVATYHVDPQSRAFSWWQQRLAERGPFRAGE